jgi:hypothetical protein
LLDRWFHASGDHAGRTLPDRATVKCQRDGFHSQISGRSNEVLCEPSGDPDLLPSSSNPIGAAICLLPPHRQADQPRIIIYSQRHMTFRRITICPQECIAPNLRDSVHMIIMRAIEKQAPRGDLANLRAAPDSDA